MLMSGGHLMPVWRLSGGCLAAVWRLSGGCEVTPDFGDFFAADFLDSGFGIRELLSNNAFS